MATVITRLAPSPTGALHLGNIWAFLLCWLYARSRGGKVLLRVDDIDVARSRPEFERAIRRDLTDLGLTWDGEPIYQSRREKVYNDALEWLKGAGLVYPCYCARRELKLLAAAPHGEEPVYPGFCRNLTPEERAAKGDKSAAFRLKSDIHVKFTDLIAGEQNFQPKDYGGDFPLKRADGIFSYQLASALDDAEVTHVIRGRDLLTSAARQTAILTALGKTPPVYGHVPLLMDETGERLAKRHKSLSARFLLDNGVKPEKIIGYLAKLAGLNPGGEPRTASELADSFSLTALPTRDVRARARDLSAL